MIISYNVLFTVIVASKYIKYKVIFFYYSKQLMFTYFIYYIFTSYPIHHMIAYHNRHMTQNNVTTGMYD